MFDTFKGKKYKKELDELSKEHENLKSLLTPEMQDVFERQKLLSLVEKNLADRRNDLAELHKSYKDAENALADMNKKIRNAQKQLIDIDDELSLQDYGLYKPKYSFANALNYKEKLDDVKLKQKEMIKKGSAVSGVSDWTVNGSKTQGTKMVKDFQKLLLMAFNSQCDETVDNVKYTNFDASKSKIEKLADNISKLGKILSITISRSYVRLKIDELTLAFEYQQKKQEEKEAAKQARAEQREQAKVQKELEESQRKFEKEQAHYQSAYDKLLEQIKNSPENADLIEKQQDLEGKLKDIDKALNDIDYRQANMKAGYVYVISNIGAFGENVFKIGMTRRLDPQDRIDELGDASVPFNFDVHAMIFSDDAPALEAALHRAFESKKLNMVNQRREFFNVTIDEIKEVVKNNYDKTVEFIDIPDAEQYRESVKMKEVN